VGRTIDPYRRRWPPAIVLAADLTGEFTLGETAALFERCMLVITNDSASNLAVPVDATVAIFGPSNPTALMPASSQRHVAVAGAVPCSRRSSIFPAVPPRFAESVSVEQVLEAASGMSGGALPVRGGDMTLHLST
jgi:ADP-heptose:LPS heptosyltransferase